MLQFSGYGQPPGLFGHNPAGIGPRLDTNINTRCQRGPDCFLFNGRKYSAEGRLSVQYALWVFSIRTLIAARGASRALFSEILHKWHASFPGMDYLL